MFNFFLHQLNFHHIFSQIPNLATKLLVTIKISIKKPFHLVYLSVDLYVGRLCEKNTFLIVPDYLPTPTPVLLHTYKELKEKLSSHKFVIC